MADAPISATDSVPVDMSPEVPESPKNADIPVFLNNPNTENEPIFTSSPEETTPLEPTYIRANPVSNGTSEPSDEVREFLHVSDATATRYLSQLEKENKIKQVGKTGKGVLYFRI